MTTYKPSEARELGFTITRREAVKIVGSSTGLQRKISSGELVEGRDWVTVFGKTKPTRMFSGSLLEMAGIRGRQVPEQILDRVAAAGPADPLAGVVAAILLPHKLFLTLDEARDLTNWPKSQLHKHSELVHGRRLIRRAKLDKL